MRVILLALLLVPLVPAQGTPPLHVEIDDAAFAYGPEGWKGGDPASSEDPASLAQQTADWNASLGLRWDVDLTISPRSGATAADWVYEATATDGTTTVQGVVREQAAGRLRTWFDVDGQRAVPGLAAVPPLLPGSWTVRVEAYEPEGASLESRGWGQATADTAGLALTEVRGRDAPLAGIAIPEGVLPRIREVGPGPNTWLNMRPVTDGILEVCAQTTPGHAVTWVAYRAVDALPPLPDPLLGTPLEGTAGSPTLQWQRQEIATTTAGPDGTVVVPFLLNGTGLQILAGYGHQGGVIAIAVAVAERIPVVDAWQTPDPGASGSVEVGMSAPGLRARQAAPGQAYVLEQAVPATTGRHLGGKALTQGPVFLDGEGHWRAVFDARPVRSAGVANYTFLAFLFDEAGDYRSHLGIVRGLHAGMDVPRLGIGHAADIRLVLHNLADDGEAAAHPPLAWVGTTRLDFAGDEAGNRSLRVPEGGVLRPAFRVTPSDDGTQEITAIIDSGDIRYELRRVAPVLRKDAFEDKPWYDPDRLTPGPGLALLLLVIAVAARRRSDGADDPPGPSQP